MRHESWGRGRYVSPGDCYRKTGRPKPVWEVERLIAEIDGIRHFRLRDRADPSSTIVVSERALFNRRYFEPLKPS
ncbi:MAG TPA: hypothetical protein VKY65_16070 [Alphaproteobacteria bacterium]|nr:hypothetical protein [Alphaproteobacteria bacterium]